MGMVICSEQHEKTLSATSFRGPNGIVRGYDSSTSFITKWANKSDDLMWDVLLKKTGLLTVSICLANDDDHGEAVIEVQIGQEVLRHYVTNDTHYKKSTNIDMGSITIEQPGHYTIRLRAKESPEGDVGRLFYIELGGPASKRMKNKTIFNIKPGSIVLQWNTENRTADMLYSEVLINRRGTGVIVVFGIHRVIISLQAGGINIFIKDDIPPKKKKKNTVLQHAYIVQHSRTASAIIYKGHSELNCFEPFDWKPGRSYEFLLKSKEYEMDKSMIYSVHFKEKESDTWRLIVIFKLCNYQELIDDVFSSIEMCQEYHGHTLYKAQFGPLWRHRRDLGWTQITKGTFSRKDKKGWQSDINAGVTKDQVFFLATGGCIEQTTKLDSIIWCEQSMNLPKCLTDLNSDTSILLE